MKNTKQLRSLALALAVLGLGVGAQAQNVLVFDSGTHQHAWAAAQVKFPGSATLATTTDFATKVQSGAFDIVIANAPSGLLPGGAWPALAAHVAGGDRAALAFWDWDNDVGYGDPALFPAFEVSAPVTLSLGVGTVLQDSGTTALFQGVTMPNGDWHDHWSDDGDTFTVTGGGVPVAHFGDPTRPTVVLGNGGRTLAMPCFDEAGDTWLNDGSALRLWENVCDLMVTGGCTSTLAEVTSRVGTPPNPDVLQAVTSQGPVVGSSFQAFVDHTTFLPTAILDVASVCAFQLNVATTSGTLLVDLGSQVAFQFVNAGQPFDFSVPYDCAFVGIGATLQVGSLDATNLQLTNALDLKIGTL
ncbi:MAG: hypothetical protein P1V81_06675 [Planctomycetota bacterium]|nr:hypothetical protein [Planctomycetota bacterium]